MRARINTCRIPVDFLRMCIRIEIEFISQTFFHVCAFISVTRQIPAKRARYARRIQSRWCSDFSRMCMCIEFVLQVLKQKNAHVSFPVGMVPLVFWGCL